MKKTIYTLCCTLMAFALNAQNAKLSGRITDEKGEGLISVNVIIDASKGWATVSDFDGNYELSVPAGTYEVSFRYIGKEEQKDTLTLKAGATFTQNITLKEKQQIIEQVVVSGSKYERKLKEETVSMDVMKGTTFKDQNITSLDAGVQKIPGVTIADGQANIRGGAGWSYGAGSRVAVLYDGLPVTTADADDAKWAVIPMEQVEQVEVIKGASSALYGSGALNGIINAITAWPTDKPYTSVQTYFGFYGNPPNGSMRWWLPGQLQYFSGFSVADRRKLGKQIDLNIAAGYTSDQGYLDSSQAYDMHLDVKFRYRVKKIEGLSMGFNVVAYYSWGKTFFLWDSIASKGYEPLPGTITIYHDGRYLFDPFLTYYDKRDNKFTFKYRYLNSTNLNTTGQGSIGQRNYLELQYARMMKKFDLNIIAGAVGMYDIADAPPGDSVAASLIGNHNRGNFAAYAQVDKRFVKRVNTTLGVRWEYFNVDDTLPGSHNGRKNSLSDLKYPLARVGLNWQAAEGTFLRVSGGLSFRYPSLAEMYVNTSLGPVGIFSNPSLQPEKGYSAEVGARQLIKISNNWGMYGDVAVYLNEYQNMMEFTFGQFGDPNNLQNHGVGFSSQNIGTARILGTDVGLGLQGKAGDFGVGFLAGYTYIDAKSLNWNDTLKLYNPQGQLLPVHETYAMTSSSAYTSSGVFAPTNANNFLKYRPRNQLKLLLTLSYKFFEINADYQYLGFQQNIDEAFLTGFLTSNSAFEGLSNYRAMQVANGSKGYNILNVGVGFKVTQKFKVAAIVKNAANTEWMTRPGMFQAPRNYTLQLTYTF